MTFTVLDQIFVGIFLMEILLKWYYGFFSFWKSGWNVFDCVLVVTALLGPSNKPFIIIALAFVGSGRILRMLRVVRAFRSLRSVQSLSGLLTVIRAIFASVTGI